MISRTLLRQQNHRLLRVAATEGSASTSSTNFIALRPYHTNVPVLSSRLPWMAGSNHMSSLLSLDRREESNGVVKYPAAFVKLLPDGRQTQQSQQALYNRLLSTSTAPSSTSDKDENKSEPSKPAEKATFRTMVRQYGPIFISTYLTVYVSTVFGFYLGITSGALDPAYLMSFITSSAENADPDAAEGAVNSVKVIKEVLNKYAWTQPAVPFVEKYPWAANLGVAWVVTKPTEPIRFGLTVGLTPLVARMLGYNNIKMAEKAMEEAKEEAST